MDIISPLLNIFLNATPLALTVVVILLYHALSRAYKREEQQNDMLRKCWKQSETYKARFGVLKKHHKEQMKSKKQQMNEEGLQK